jgi:hypothetical protein
LDLQEAITAYACRAAEKLYQQDSHTGAVMAPIVVAAQVGPWLGRLQPTSLACSPGVGNHIKKTTEPKPDSYPEPVANYSNGWLLPRVIDMNLIVLNQSIPHPFKILKPHFLGLNTTPENDVPLFVLT